MHRATHGRPRPHAETRETAIPPPTLEARVKAIIKVKGRRFKDLNGNGTLDVYEDWRRPAESRVADLVGRMTLVEKAGLMLIDTMNADCEGAVPEIADDYINNQQMHRFIFRNPVDASGSCEGGPGRSGYTITPVEAAMYTNSVQEMVEATRLGIPALFKSNARNHIDPEARSGINVSTGAFSAFPKEAGIAAAALGQASCRTGRAPTTGDMSIVKKFAQVMGEEWRSIGLRGMYGYMADLSTEPRWYRTHETFTEDADLAANIMASLVGTLQGPADKNGVSLSPRSSVALTIKHFPGGGPQAYGYDPHYAYGKTQVYPGDGFGYNLKPFQAAIDAGVSAIMPYYGVPMQLTYNGVAYDQIGFSFSGQIINGLLRDQLGFAGYVNSDTGVINDRAWGLETATVPERVAAAINGGTDTLSGFNNVQTIIDLVNDGLVSEARVNEAAGRLLTPLFQMGLFENPYVDAQAAGETVGKAENREVALAVQRKSIVLLQNENDLLPLVDGATVYLLGEFDMDAVASYGYTVINGNEADNAPGTGAAAAADYTIINVTASTDRSVTSTYASNNPATGLNEDYINPVVFPDILGLDGMSPYGAADACVAYGAAACTDSRLIYGGSLPWEAGDISFSRMGQAASWKITPSLETIRTAMDEAGAQKVVLHIYFRQPYVLDEASGLRDAGAIVAGFGVSDPALFDVLSGKFNPQGKMPFALAGTIEAIEEQFSDLPGYEETTDGALFEFGYGLSYETCKGKRKREKP